MKVMLSLSTSVAVGAVMMLTSCDKTKDLYQTAADKVKELSGEEKTEEASVELVRDVRTVDDAEGKSVIQSERRLVMVEFYSDT